MDLTPKTSIHDLIEAYPFLVDFLPAYNPKYSLLRNKVMRATVGRMATLEKVATIGEVEIDDLIEAIRAEVRRQTGGEPGVGEGDERVGAMRAIIEELHAGLPLEEAKRRFDEVVKDVEPGEIARMEERLVRGGLPVAEVQRLCDLHVGVFEHALGGNEDVDAPPGHPVHTYLAENEVIAGTAGRLDGLLKRLDAGESLSALGPELESAVGELSGIDNHYVRKENQVFPYLEKHDVTAPPRVMWGVHDEIRDKLKQLRSALEQGQAGLVVERGFSFVRAVTEMVFKENKIFLPLCMETLSEEEWKEVREGEDELGYAFVQPEARWPVEAEDRVPGAQAQGLLDLSTGRLSREQIDLVMTHLPVDLSFVDADGYVRYYSEGPERIFPRSPAVIGRHVENCHPPGSVATVRRILEAFASGEKDSAEFWIEVGGRFIHIRYFAVRDREGVYQGCLEVSQDISRIRHLGGQRRLLDWDD